MHIYMHQVTSCREFSNANEEISLKMNTATIILVHQFAPGPQTILALNLVLSYYRFSGLQAELSASYVSGTMHSCKSFDQHQKLLSVHNECLTSFLCPLLFVMQTHSEQGVATEQEAIVPNVDQKAI